MSDTETEIEISIEEQDLIRADVKRLVAERKISMTKMADEAGIAYGTFSQWIACKYAGKNERIAAEARKWVHAQATRERVAAQRLKSPGYIPTPTSAKFMAVLDHAQFSPDMVLIGAGAGVDKTSSIAKYASAHTNVWHVTAEPMFRSIYIMMDAVAAAMGISERWSAGTVSRTVQRHMRGSEGLLVMDEAQHLPTPSLDQLRTLHDLTQIGVAIIGNESVYTNMEGYGRTPQFAQLFRRVGMRMTVSRSTTADINAVLDAYDVQPEDVRRLLMWIAKKPGALGGMVKTLKLAFMLGEGTVTTTSVHQAFRQITNTALLAEAA